MPDADLGLLNAEAVARVSRLELLARNVVEGFLTGRHHSRFRGASLEFAQHREYVPGDDLRRLDWKVWARADRLTVKQYEADSNLRATLLVDASASMAYGAGDQNKFQFASGIAAVLAYALLRQSDAVGLACFDSEIRREAPPSSAKQQLRVVLAGLQGATPQSKTDLGGMLSRWAARPEPRGLIVLVSDLLAEAAPLLKGLRLLRQKGHDVVLLQVLHPDETTFPFERTTLFEGMESGARLRCDPKSLRAGYLAALEKHLGDLRRTSAELGVDYRLTRTDESLSAVLAALFQARERR